MTEKKQDLNPVEINGKPSSKVMIKPTGNE